MLETCSWSILAFRGKSQPFLVDPTVGFAKTMQAPDDSMRLRHVDPLLGWGYEPSAIRAERNLKNEYAVFGSQDSRAFRIAITGGSTTDSFHNPHAWPIILTEKMRKAGYCVCTYVGGVSGYNSNQEMLKILRDQFELQPQLHISYSGVNEIEKDWYILSSYYLVNLTNKMVAYRRAPVLPNTVGLVSGLLKYSDGQVVGVNTGLDQPHAPWDRWANNLRRMHALAQEYDYTFIGVLQPILGIGKYSPSAVETERIKDMNLVSDWSDFYEGARKNVKAKPYMHDFVDLFSGQSGLYTDDCHVTDEGNQMIADKMYEMLSTQYSGLLKKSRILDCQL